MRVKSIVENEKGIFEFQAELTPQQHAFLIEYAIRDLVKRGLLPFITAETEADLLKVMPQPDEQVMQ